MYKLPLSSPTHRSNRRTELLEVKKCFSATIPFFSRLIKRKGSFKQTLFVKDTVKDGLRDWNKWKTEDKGDRLNVLPMGFISSVETLTYSLSSFFFSVSQYIFHCIFNKRIMFSSIKEIIIPSLHHIRGGTGSLSCSQTRSLYDQETFPHSPVPVLCNENWTRLGRLSVPPYSLARPGMSSEKHEIWNKWCLYQILFLFSDKDKGTDSWIRQKTQRSPAVNRTRVLRMLVARSTFVRHREENLIRTGPDKSESSNVVFFLEAQFRTPQDSHCLNLSRERKNAFCGIKAKMLF